MVTSASPLQNEVEETRRALDELGQDGALLAESWRRELEGARRTLSQVADGHVNGRTLRSLRALAATAAHEEWLAAQYEYRLVTLSDERLREVSAQLEHSFASLRAASAEAGEHLTGAGEDLLAELRAEVTLQRAAALAGLELRYQERFADDIVAAMRAYAERIEQLLLELGEAAHAAVGTPAGGLLPTRVSHVPPRPDLGHISVGDADRMSEELSAVVGRMIDLFRDRLAGQVEEAIETLRTRIDGAAQSHALGKQATYERADELTRSALSLKRLAERLDWMLFDDR